MAKKKINKAAEIRNELAKSPDAKGVEIVAALKARGVSVSPAQVSNLKTKTNNKTATKKTGAKKGPKPKLGLGEKIRAAVHLLTVSTKAEALELIEALGK